ncbi:hypothetical protein HK104_006370 [Borealophlyctis nickersoniae]|nr:hypothetical protein HK104_006370 [Borealophlyctis nickersoniae]
MSLLSPKHSSQLLPTLPHHKNSLSHAEKQSFPLAPEQTQQHPHLVVPGDESSLLREESPVATAAEPKIVKENHVLEGVSEAKAKAALSIRLKLAFMDRQIPTSDQVIDLIKLGLDSPALSATVLSLLHTLLPHSWAGVTSIKVDRISGAMTNCVFRVSGIKNGSVETALLRVYGSGADQFVEREHEMLWLCRLSDMGCGPNLLATFGNGRFEEWLDSTTLNKYDLRDPVISSHIAEAMCRLHHLIRACDEEEVSTPPDLWKKMRAWHKLAMKAYRKMEKSHPLQLKKLEGLNVEALSREIDELEERLSRVYSPVVFSHNDTQYGNVLKLKGSDQIMIVDYEYSGINYRGYDIGNHFCEWAADYHSADPHVMDFSAYPTKPQQLHFLTSYLAESSHLTNTTPLLPGSPEHTAQLEEMCKEVNKYALCSHVLWGLWGIMQAAQSEIEFDYAGYGVGRLKRYFEIKEEVLAM